MLCMCLITGSPLKFAVSFRQAENYPVDLYYIMDMSNSMADDKDRVALLGESLGDNSCVVSQCFIVSSMFLLLFAFLVLCKVVLFLP